MAQRAEYRSSRRSRKLIKKAFAKLLHEKELSKITVTDIINEAEISRGTFYAHYPDVYGLFEKIESEELEILMGFLDQVGYDELISNPAPVISATLDYINQDLEYYRLLFLSKNANLFMLKLKELLTNRIINDPTITTVYCQSPEEAAVYVSFFSTAIACVFVDWLRGDFDISLEELSAISSKILHNCFSAKPEA